MQLSFYGAAGEVTGSNYLLETPAATVLIDCGAFQGGKDQELKNAAPFLYDPARVDSLVLSHAHLDHVGRVGKLVAEGFRGNIWCTPATKELAELILFDAASIMSHDELKFGDRPLYRDEDVWQALRQCKTVDYGVRVQIAEGVEIRLQDAGHILGAASIELWAEKKKFLFSGDLGNLGAPIVRDPTVVTETDYVICESTYGNRTHDPIKDREIRLKRAIDASVKQRGVLLIPSFALERTQELLHALNHLVTSDQIADVPIFLDSPLAIKATEVFERFPEYYDTEAAAHVKQGEAIFAMQGLKLARTTEESKAINLVPPPKIIIAGSGMMTGGRMMHHLNQYIDVPTTTILFVGYQAQGTLGRRIFDGATEIDLFHKPRVVKAHVEAVGSFSAHADAPQLLRWLGSIKQPTQCWLVHGDPESLLGLKTLIDDQLKIPTLIPRFGQHVTVST